jgi:hypothetical protein
MIGDVFDGQHATIAVADHDRVRKPALGYPSSGVTVIGDPFACQLEDCTLGSAVVTDRGRAG